ncbi:MAG: hypothetical protein JSR72_01895 [Proteobacteria bacterium]|nr:hypothetical protein [Pseudomonadota bacterium]
MRSSLSSLGTVIGALAAAALFAAGVTTPAGADNRTLPMRFELRMEGPAAQCGLDCATYVSAAGAITADSPRDFKSFMQSATANGHNLKGATVVMDSDGGSVLGAIALGREIRSARLSTMVGRVVDIADQPKGSKVPRAKLSPYADCESMCAFVMLGGIKRSVPSEARVMVHQIWLGDRREDPTAANYSAEDLVLVQRDIGRLARFTEDMGASMDLLDLALRIPPWEPLHVMSRDELTNTRLATEGPAMPEVAAVATSSQATNAATTAPRAPVRADRPMTNGSKLIAKPMPISERSWGLVNQDGGVMLARRHPLTVEGDQIGSFDVMLSCGADDKFAMSYVERRYAAEGLALPPQLDGVTLRIGKTRAALKIVGSGYDDQDKTLRTIAVGSVPAEVVRRFSAGFRSAVVETSSDDAVTVIRIGNTGAPQNFPQLAAACSKPIGERAEAMVQKTGGMAPAQ